MGKGSKWRKTDFSKYFENWNTIKKTKNKRHKEEIKKQGKTTYKY
jgi:hypothetical protein